MSVVYEKLLKCLESIRKKTDFEPDVAVVLGSGLGEYTEEMKIVCEVEYEDIDDFPVSTVKGHAGKFVFGYIGDVKVVCMKGRVHYYEGYDISDVVLPVRLMKLMGAKILLLTNASGGINPEYKAGDFMLMKDHISIFAPNPLIGQNIDELGVRFPDMSHVYDEELQEIVRKTTEDMNIDLKEGVYVQLTGPSFESPAEIKMLGAMGADVVGMSTVVEAIAANHMGMKICGFSFVSNPAAGISKNPLTHEEVQEAADKAAPVLRKLLRECVIRFGYILK